MPPHNRCRVFAAMGWGNAAGLVRFCPPLSDQQVVEILGQMVGATGIEPVTPAMSRRGRMRKDADVVYLFPRVRVGLPRFCCDQEGESRE